ncbi:hypothetical protein I3842_10G023300 [Carya illinoinensis]|uniref:Uncharacterized protein n=1 Tax=Carya illinoinensis TaxID=32201 RepID=A0A922DUI3_CARIL|nr:hypothetical protein I3842_10G023300 [Carya illinoinensis]
MGADPSTKQPSQWQITAHCSQTEVEIYTVHMCFQCSRRYSHIKKPHTHSFRTTKTRRLSIVLVSTDFQENYYIHRNCKKNHYTRCEINNNAKKTHTIASNPQYKKIIILNSSHQNTLS